MYILSSRTATNISPTNMIVHRLHASVRSDSHPYFYLTLSFAPIVSSKPILLHWSIEASLAPKGPRLPSRTSENIRTCNARPAKARSQEGTRCIPGSPPS